MSGDIIAHLVALFELFQALRRHPGAPGAAMLQACEHNVGADENGYTPVGRRGYFSAMECMGGI